jgi:aspartate-semialdehyde dehydrogenase
MKMINETRKIMGDDTIKVTATAVRIPVIGGHSESVNIKFSKSFELSQIRQILSTSPGIVVADNTANNEYPMPLTANEKDEVFVGRIRRDESVENGLNLWIVSDNLRKGAATNAVQIAEYLIQNNILNK